MKVVSEQSLVAWYRARFPRSRVQGILRYRLNTSYRRARECILCHWQGPTWSASWPKPKGVAQTEADHVRFHLDKTFVEG